MPVIGGNPEALRDDLQDQAIADNAQAEAEAEAERDAREAQPFDPVDVVRQMRGEPAKATVEARAVAEQIRRLNGY